MRKSGKKNQFNTPFLEGHLLEGGEHKEVTIQAASVGADVKDDDGMKNSDSGSAVTNANMFYEDRKFFTTFCQNKVLSCELALTLFLLITFQLTLMEKLWDPLVFDKVLDNWTLNPFNKIQLLDFTGEEYNDYWNQNYQNEQEISKLKFDCPTGYEEIGEAYWYGLKDGCICNGEYGGKY